MLDTQATEWDIDHKISMVKISKIAQFRAKLSPKWLPTMFDIIYINITHDKNEIYLKSIIQTININIHLSYIQLLAYFFIIIS